MLSEQKQAQGGGLQQTPAAWLKKIIEDNSPPPTLFAWTAANLTSGSSCSPATTRDNAKLSKTASDRIYVLGVGNLGRLIATSLSQIPAKAPITLVVHRKSLLEHWDSTPGIEMARHGKVDRFTDFDVEWWTDEKPTNGPVHELTPIKNLIVATKAQDVIPQIDKLRRYLCSASTVAFVQNGMCKLWPPEGELYLRLRFPDHTGPSWLACVTTHGVTSLAHFRSVHASVAGISIGPVKANSHSGDAHRYLLSQIARAPHLEARVVSTGELWVLQLEKLVVNSVLNPLTAIMDCENGELFVDREDMLSQVVDALIREASIVLTSLALDPAGQNILGSGADDGTSRGGLGREVLLQRFSFSSLRHVVYDVGYKVWSHISSMLQDVRSGKQTEIQECNGWLLKTAESLDLGHELPTHQKVISIVEDGGRLSRKQLIQHCIPLSPLPCTGPSRRGHLLAA
ncbi:2-dehydropantoate 2-reductase (Ketopantoate reductase) (KPA reductase) (KPR) [Diaporthe australafricana]|uniref:2-dehydropantoate 2-reductase (Ketopantoate reductase) (KPA reductase) (KPR) n=1 Tax=Diaporthe australafricana TaxID=127596 RepID=A0ABR3X0X9_9PEZI